MADGYKEILEKILSLASKIGTRETIKALDNISTFDTKVSLLLSIIKAKLNVSITQIQEKNKRRTDNIYYAKHIFSYLLEKELNISRYDISILTKKSLSVVNGYVNSLNDGIAQNTPFHRNFNKYFIEVQTEFKNQLNK